MLPADTGAMRFQDTLRRAMDVVLAGLALVALLPLLAGVAIAIKLSGPGPVFFRQERYGRNNRLFSIYKFRTMRSEDCDMSGVSQTSAGDPRVTAVGQFLRQTSIDELPQLINILKGDMAVVGPRPHVPGMFGGGQLYEELVPYYMLRHSVRPGLTGWAQVNGFRGPTVDPAKARGRIDHDIAYVQNRSLALDIRIIALTARREFLTGSGF